MKLLVAVASVFLLVGCIYRMPPFDNPLDPLGVVLGRGENASANFSWSGVTYLAKFSGYEATFAYHSQVWLSFDTVNVDEGASDWVIYDLTATDIEDQFDVLEGSWKDAIAVLRYGTFVGKDDGGLDDGSFENTTGFIVEGDGFYVPIGTGIVMRPRANPYLLCGFRFTEVGDAGGRVFWWGWSF